ncbi:xylulose 5-phosphate 3-epimerase [Pusillimonas sp. CC-YST705]|uniref:Xylulose 5-phosphate 3-epimerase n=1 Tax=Mesopusillimonas faecipullorum TaxID=2755040 RepID=A0ABS8C948_9BURK|nr:xylulose 5-phosphate 3-epimerase [Mesopusillimonas faecipullorum]MCB5362545.1 xylulose 5-phosphate 3-epimerase [Mesopusillimonas faecipullorum]
MKAGLMQAGNTWEVWRQGYGLLTHRPETVTRVRELVTSLTSAGLLNDEQQAYAWLQAADRLCSAAMWVVVHMSYAQRVNLSGLPLQAHDFKPNPEGHTGGALNMVPAFVGYLLANVLSGRTRSWLMAQGHSVAAIEAVNALTGDVSPAQKGRYDRSEQGLSRLAADFYSYAMDAQGRPGVPLGSHAGPNTAGAVSEGGYLGFASLLYPHMPLPGESLVAFLSDGAFEEQRGSDWAPRWWRAQDSGLIVPLMVLNGRRIEERTQIMQDGGAPWLADHLRHNGFDPVTVDGRDPAAIAWGIVSAEAKLQAFAQQANPRYPAAIPYVIAETVKGYGFPGAGKNPAHNLPLPGNPHTDIRARELFNAGAQALYVPQSELETALQTLSVHGAQQRQPESRHALAHRQPEAPVLPMPEWAAAGAPPASAMQAVDHWFVQLAQANPHLRIRVGNPDELASNQMGQSLQVLKHRVNEPEAGVPESVHGAVITALNEEAVAAAALGNKGGLNLIVSYEAFAVKMLGILRQEIIFTRHQKDTNQAPGWLTVPLIATSHTWENAKNEQSHQDPTIAETLLAEMSDVSRVLFPVDGNSAVAALRHLYAQRGQVACLVIAKRPMPQCLDADAARALAKQGVCHVADVPTQAHLQLIAIGAYQLQQALKARRRLALHGVRACVTLVQEPGRLRAPRDATERAFVLDDATLGSWFPAGVPRVVLSHTRPEPMLGILRRLDEGPGRMVVLGYINQGGTLNIDGMLFANRCTWGHAVQAAAQLLQPGTTPDWLTDAELAALEGRGDPRAILEATN